MEREKFMQTLTRLLSINGVSTNKMLTELGLNRSFVGDIVKRGSTPSIDSMLDISDYLGVSVYDLVGRSPPGGGALTDDERILLKRYCGLDDRGKEALLGVALAELTRVEARQQLKVHTNEEKGGGGQAPSLVHPETSETATLKRRKSAPKAEAPKSQKAE